MNEDKNSVLEEMGDFFNLRANDYDSHMLDNVDKVNILYKEIAQPIAATMDRIEILDIGCGTGLELKAMFEKSPNALITGIDLAKEMLDKLTDKYRDKKNQLNLMIGSYLEVPFGKDKFDYAVSVMTLHHFLHEQKVDLYKKVYESLKPGGIYIEGDYTVSTIEEEKKFLEEYFEVRKAHNIEDGLYHIDIPFTVDTQNLLLKRGGFENVDVLWSGRTAAIFVCKK